MSPSLSDPLSFTLGERLCWWLGLVLLAVFLTAIQLTITAPYGLTTLELLAHFKAVEPFQHRVLVPAAVAVAERLWPIDHRLAFGVIETGFWIALVVVAERALARLHIVHGEARRRLLALSLLLPMAVVTLLPDLQLWPAFAHVDGRLDLGAWGARTLYYYPYDLPAAVFTLGLFLALSGIADRPTAGRIAGLALLFAVATFNRETTVFVLPMAAWLLGRRLPVTRYLLILALLAGLFVAIEPSLQWLFSDQPNPHRQVGASQYEWHITENARYLAQPFYLLTEIVRFLGGLWLPAILWWAWLNRPLRIAVLGFVIPLVIVGLIVGRIAEHRVFIEAVPLLWLAAVQAAIARLGPAAGHPHCPPG